MLESKIYYEKEKKKKIEYSKKITNKNIRNKSRIIQQQQENKKSTRRIYQKNTEKNKKKINQSVAK
jgi:hypothetical protein